jgi:transposase
MTVMTAEELLRAAGPIERLLADTAYDTNRLRTLLAKSGIEAVIPSIARRKPMIPYDREAYRQRDLIERMFARSKTSAASPLATTSLQGTSSLASCLPPP